MNLMDDEKILWKSEQESLVLTTHRVRYHKESLGRAKLQSILLEELASCAIEGTTSPMYYVLAVVLIVLGLSASVTSRDATYVVTSLIAGSILFAIYYATRRQVLSFASAGAVIEFPVQGMSINDLKDLIDTAEDAKNKRYYFIAPQ